MGILNWRDLQKAAGESGFEVLPANEYDVVVDTATAAKAQSGKDMIKTRFKVETGPYAGRAIFNQFVISPENSNALAFFFRHMRVLGLDDAFFASGPSLEHVANTLQNKRCRVRVSISKWNDQDRNQVDAVLPPANGSPGSPSPAYSGVGGGGGGPVNSPGGVGHFAPTPTPTPTYGSSSPASTIAPPEVPF